MATYQIHLGRISFTSPGTLQLNAGADGKNLSISGKFGGVEHTIDHIKYLRDELQSMSTMDEHVPFIYDGDTTLNGYVKVMSSNVDIQKYLQGGISYDINLEYVGKTGDVQFESRLTGALLENDFITSSTNQQFHAAPGNNFAFIHNALPGRALRTARDLTSSTATDTTNLYINQSSLLRNNNSIYNLDIDDYYKGCCQIRMGEHMEKTTVGASDTVVESIKCGKYAGDWSVGDTLVLDNGLIKMVLGTGTTTASFNTYIWDVNQYATEKEWVFSEGDPASASDQHGDLFLGWHRVQILVNRPELVVVRCTTYKDSDTRGKRLVVDFSLRRGAHHIGVITNYYTAGTKINIALESAPSDSPDVTNITSGFIKDGASSPEDGNYWILGGLKNLDSDTSITDRGMLRNSANGSVFGFMVGYELVDPNTNAALSHNEAANIHKQYIDNINEYQKLVKA